MEATAGANCLVCSFDLNYSDQEAPGDPRNPIYTLLVSATETGYRQDAGGFVIRSLLPLEFTYTAPQIQPAVLSLNRDSLGNLPEGIDNSRFRWVDLDGEGSSGILSQAPAGRYYKRNFSAANVIEQSDGSIATRASFGPLETLVSVSVIAVAGVIGFARSERPVPQSQLYARNRTHRTWTAGGRAALWTTPNTKHR